MNGSGSNFLHFNQLPDIHKLVLRKVGFGQSKRDVGSIYGIEKAVDDLSDPFRNINQKGLCTAVIPGCQQLFSQIPDMIEMKMGDEDRIDMLGLNSGPNQLRRDSPTGIKKQAVAANLNGNS